MNPPQVDTIRLYSLFKNMVDHYSPSCREEELTAFLKDYLEEAGLNVVLRQVDETRYNLEVTSDPEKTGGEAVRPDILFLGHIDTVPAYDIENYALTEKEGRCFGLGTADMKSGCAAMIEAFVAASEEGRLPGNVMLSLVVGEEESGDGTQTLLENHSFQWALVAEPTDLKPCPGHYGYIEMVIRIFGYRRHAAMAKVEASTIGKMLKLLLQFEESLNQENLDIIINMRDLHSSESGFAVPDRCAASIDLHIPPGQDVYTFAGKLDNLVQSILAENFAGTAYELGFPTLTNGFAMPEDEPQTFPELIREVYSSTGTAWEPELFTSHSDANLLQEAGCKPVILGPGQLARAHTVDESVEFRQVVEAARIYTELLARL